MPRGRSLADWIDEAERTVIALLFAGMAIVTVSQVVLRYIFNAGFVWALELTTTLFAWLVLFGMSYGLKHGIHLGVDAFAGLFGSRTRRVLALLATAAGLLYAGIMFVGGYNYTMRLYQVGIEMVDLPVERWKAHLILPLGLALLGYRLLEAGYRIWTGHSESLLSRREVADTIRQFEAEGGSIPTEEGQRR